VRLPLIPIAFFRAVSCHGVAKEFRPYGTFVPSTHHFCGIDSRTACCILRAFAGFFSRSHEYFSGERLKKLKKRCSCQCEQSEDSFFRRSWSAEFGFCRKPGSSISSYGPALKMTAPVRSSAVCGICGLRALHSDGAQMKGGPESTRPSLRSLEQGAKHSGPHWFCRGVNGLLSRLGDKLPRTCHSEERSVLFALRSVSRSEEESAFLF